MITNVKGLIECVSAEIRNFTDIAVLGLSGGADSTLIAALCVHALGAENVYGISMPYNQFDEETFNARSAQIATELGIQHSVRSISGISDSIDEQIAFRGNQLKGINSGNSRSRARMCILYGVSHSIASTFEGKKVRVMGTGNFSEDYIGYDTKGGDALADIFIVGELFKSEIYQLLDYFRDQGVLSDELICRTPSAGLEDGQTDEEDLGYTYNEMQEGIKKCLDKNTSLQDLDEMTKFVWQRHATNKHKHEAPPVLSLRHFTDWSPAK